MNLISRCFFGVIIPSLILVHLIWSPYTKVEESFNIQAIHDILAYGVPWSSTNEHLIKRYDHFTFPGSVPRTFVGALAISGLSMPFVSQLQHPEFTQTLGNVYQVPHHFTKTHYFINLTLVRGILGLFNAFALLAFQNAVSHSFGKVAGCWYILFQSSQFHIMYYSSRTLPNSFAFGLTTLASRYFMLSNFGPRPRRAKRNRLGLYIITLSGIIFRAELGLFVAIQSAWLLLFRRVSLRHVILPAGVLAVTLGLLITVAVDSFFWQSFPLWPEWIAFRFNTISGKSSEWGTSPWHYYFTSSIPRLMLNPFALIICLPIALTDRLNRRFSINILAPQLAFVALLSFLPHKEWRFIMYVIPSVTAVSSAGASWIWTRRRRSFSLNFLALALVASVLATFMASIALLIVSSLNYPGASALVRLHELAEQGPSGRAMIRVHMDNLACQTGVTRFLQNPVPSPQEGPGSAGKPVWYYDKTQSDDALSSAEFWEHFDYVLSEAPEKVIGRWEVLERVEGFEGIGIVHSSNAVDTFDSSSGPFFRLWMIVESWAKRTLTKGWWIQVKMAPKIFILRKMDM